MWLAVVPVPRTRQMSLARSPLSVPGASGIDAVPHRGALAAGEQTLAVQASGLDRLYPSGNRNLLGCACVTQEGFAVDEAPDALVWKITIVRSPVTAIARAQPSVRRRPPVMAGAPTRLR
jgi:DNA recombination-mediator protein A